MVGNYTWVVGRVVAAAVLTSLVAAQVALACTCAPEHPQNHYCGAHFVIKAKVKAVETVRMKTMLENGKTRRGPLKENQYRITVNKVLKETPEFQQVFANATRHYVYSPDESGLCGIHLDIDKKYLLTGRMEGNKAYVYQCNFMKEWSHLPVRMRKGFNFQYEKNCACKVDADFGPGEEIQMAGDAANHCRVNLRADPDRCYFQHSICKLSSTDEEDEEEEEEEEQERNEIQEDVKRRRRRKKKSQCRWTRPRVLKDCMKKSKETATPGYP